MLSGIFGRQLKESFWSLFSFYHMDSGDQTKVISAGGMCLPLLRLLTSSGFYLKVKVKVRCPARKEQA